MNDINKSIVMVDDEQVFTSDYVFTQMMAQSCRIDRANTIGKVALAMSTLSLLGIIYLLMQIVR